MQEVTERRPWSIGLIMTTAPYALPCTFYLFFKLDQVQKEKDKNNSKNINLFMYKNLCKIYNDYLKIDRGRERFLPLF